MQLVLYMWIHTKVNKYDFTDQLSIGQEQAKFFFCQILTKILNQR